jgi:hypothetical protein
MRIINFGQRLRNKKKRFPDCPPELLTAEHSPPPAAIRGESQPEEEVEEEVETEGEGERPHHPPAALPEGLIWNVEDELLSNQILFEQICCAAGKSKELGKASLKKYHLWLESKSSYPKQRKALQSGFSLWLINEKSNGDKAEVVKTGPSLREIEEAENRKKLGM